MSGIVETRKNLAELINRAAYGKERIPLLRRGKKVAYIVPVDDVKVLERIEDKIDEEEARKAIEALRSGKEKTITLDELMVRLGFAPKKAAAKKGGRQRVAGK